MTLRIVADENMPNVGAWFSSDTFSVVRKPGRTLTKKDLLNANVLLVRSITQVNSDLLHETPVQFVGSATIGTDHIDQLFLKLHNIQFSYAPGCNAQSVVDWLLSAFSKMHIKQNVEWWNKTIGVVGVGNVGGRVVERLKKLGCEVLVCDPLKHADGLLPDHIDLDEMLKQVDIVCFHTPHTKDVPHATHQMIDASRLAQMKDDAWVINAGRGPVFSSDVFNDNAQSNNLNFVMDVWPEEPSVSDQQLNQCFLSSPHVAGYSLEGKFKGTEMLAQSVYKWTELPLPHTPSMPEGACFDVGKLFEGDVARCVSELVLSVYDPEADTHKMKNVSSGEGINSEQFDAMRKNYPQRRELASVTLLNVPVEMKSALVNIGFKL